MLLTENAAILSNKMIQSKSPLKNDETVCK